MAYCRFGSNDIYLYEHVDGYICCCTCRLTPKTAKTIFTTGGTTPFIPDGIEKCDKCHGVGCDHCCMHHDKKLKSYEDAIEHVKKHIEAGHNVNEEVIPRLERERKIEDSKNKLRKSQESEFKKTRMALVSPKRKKNIFDQRSTPTDLIKRGLGLRGLRGGKHES